MFHLLARTGSGGEHGAACVPSELERTGKTQWAICGMIRGQTTLGHHLFRIAITSEYRSDCTTSLARLYLQLLSEHRFLLKNGMT
jgi:hypothetical protein